MKRKLFIGSSSEGLKVAQNIKSIIENKCGDWIEVTIWNEGDIFTLNAATLDCLIRTAMRYDYAVLVATNDDVVIKRGVGQLTARDNVIFEAGLFLGALGKNRTFIVTDKVINLPTDFNGITVCYYDSSSAENSYTDIIKELRKTQHSHNLKHLPSAALAMGYFDNFIIPFCNKRKESKLKVVIPQKFDSIDREISSYSSQNATKVVRLLSKCFRSIGYKYRNANHLYWDIPTTLQTLRKLLENITTGHEIGKNPELEEWLKTETHNFGHTLEELIFKENLCKDRIQVEYV